MQSIAPELMVWKEPLKFRLRDVDFTGHATITGVCWSFLEAAWNHAHALGVGNSELQKLDKFWVLSRLLIEAKNYPAWGSVGTLRTWPRTVTHLFAMRDFEVLDPSGNVMIAGSSAWLVLDLASRRPQRISKILPGLDALKNRSALSRDPEKLPDCQIGDRHCPSPVRYSDLDVNGHMNSSCYISAALDAYPVEFHRAHSVRSLEINYLDETHAGQTLDVRSRQSAPSTFNHSMHNDKEVCRMRLDWMSTPSSLQAAPNTDR
jgi:medium-chain acyl-[acyl-carrier-protein] hydrolase